MELAPGFNGKDRHPAVYPLHHIGVVGTPLSAAGSAGIPLFVGCAAFAASDISCLAELIPPFLNFTNY